MYHIRLYVVFYQKLSMTYVLYTSPLLITVVAETDLTVTGLLYYIFKTNYQRSGKIGSCLTIRS